MLQYDCVRQLPRNPASTDVFEAVEQDLGDQRRRISDQTHLRCKHDDVGARELALPSPSVVVVDCAGQSGRVLRRRTAHVAAVLRDGRGRVPSDVGGLLLDERDGGHEEGDDLCSVARSQLRRLEIYKADVDARAPCVGPRALQAGSGSSR